tara:strand:- start:3780 stop:6470 length:2691 start_codon:yes stop_codon:yes gene_type:complete
MPINYTQSFQSGELSRKMDSRSDLDQYKTGCRDLDNFYVLPQGGVERRTGTKYINLTGDEDSIDGAASARLFAFDFSDTAKYVVEVGTNYIKIFNGIAETDGTYLVYEPLGTVPAYTATELHELQAVRRYDTMVITHRNHEPLLLRRLTVAPTFSVSEIDYVYPPLMDMNVTATNLNPTSAAVGDTEIQTYSDSTTLVADVINNDHVNSIWGINYVRSSGNRKQDVSINDNTGVNGANEIDVSFSNFSIGLIGNLIGTVTVERKVGSGSYEDFVILGTSTGSSIFSFSSTVAEEANTQIRLKVEGYSGTGTMTGTIIAQERFSKGLTKIKDGSDILGASITDVAFGTNELELTCNHGLSSNDKVTIKGVKRSGSLIDSELVNLTVTDGALGGGSTGSKFHVPLTGSYSTSDFSLDNAIIYSASRIDVENLSALGGTTGTIFWEEAAFSDYRKFPIAAEFYQNRLFFTGSKDEPATIFGSVFNDIFNFLTGSTSDMSIKRIPDTAAEAKSLTGKKDLFMGTDGGMVSIRSVNPDQLISPTNINTEIQNSYGSSLVQPVIANDVVVYLQGNKLKLRELVYSRDNDVYIGNDLNLMSEEITGTGIRQMFVQKNPNQIIWCIKEDGTACILSYDRAAGLMGWANIVTTGTIESGTVLSTSGEDDVWLVVKRGTKYAVEKFESRSDATWYVDSGSSVTANNPTSLTVGTHLDGETVQILFDGSFHSTATVSSGAVTISNDFPVWKANKAYNKDETVIHSGTVYNAKAAFTSGGAFSSGNWNTNSSTAIAGLQFISTLRPMPIEPVLAGKISQSRVKAVAKMVVRFVNTKGAQVGEAERQLTSFPVVKTTDTTGQVVPLKTDSFRFFVGSDYEREKLVEVRQDLPYPMTVLSIASNINVEGA